MEKSQLESTLRRIFSEVFNVPESHIEQQTKQHDLEGWDSLGQLRLVMAIEEQLNISFQMEAIAQLDTFLKIVDYCGAAE